MSDNSEPARASGVTRLRATGLTVERRGQTLLRDLSVEAWVGTAICISGPSGSGKSTLLRTLARLECPTAGTVQLDGVDAQGIPYRDYRRRVSLVFQEAPMFEGTVADNVRFGPGLFGNDVPDDDVVALLEGVSLGPAFAARDAAQLSGGERQRVALARALANEPDVMLLDEPTSALDPEAAGRVLSYLKARVSKGLTIIAVLHTREHAQALGDQHWQMHQGQLVSEVTR